VTREHGIGFVKRLPVFVVLCFILNDDFDPNEEDHEMIRMLKVVLSHIQFPFSLDMMQGPSMLPTIHPTNDTLLRDPLSHRYFGRSWQVGDIVLFAQTDEASKMKRYSCKRIVALPGQQVNRHGEFMTQLYALDVHPLSSSALATTTQSVDSIGDNDTIVIPEDHVWLEGDNPLFSLDSRQYGPVPMAALKGRYVLRLWPLGKQNWMNQKRPTPLTIEEMFSNKTYNLFSIPRKQSTLEESSAKG
jgi:inner membrane protease subunit 1